MTRVDAAAIAAGGAAGGASRTPARTFRLGSWLSFRYRLRPVVVSVLLVVVTVILGVATLTLGRLGIALPDLPGALLGDVSGKEKFILGVIRGPRLVVALGAGFAFGVAGSIFQRVTRNPLGSPDVIGLTAGASAGAVSVSLLWPNIIPVPVGALIGAVAAMIVVYASTGRGFAAPQRLIVAGIGVSALSLAFVQFVLSRAQQEQATVVSGWLNGSLEAKDWSDAAVVWVSVIVFTVLALALAPRTLLVELGDDIADGVGARSSATRVFIVLIAIALSAAAVSVCGPIAFIALTAPHIARALTRDSGAGLVAAGLTGSALLVAADLLVQQAPLPQQLPVGIVTAGMGGLFLGFLLIRQWRRTG
ncbi:FecCD family ABC transporter permease [Okibacterium fritillariae]|uniref:Iron complex transport system permease protein n=1 Tax=Okibacterium fritillariae TaxID=123320 RepID=A0A1T5KIR6_9MICO|nr:iron chelate uptake ABC transporter family permease subunit [Okibacterium fritillariae]SKC63634.1 iron complex transport system permease protein [Okibacterium fritillariae]